MRVVRFGLLRIKESGGWDEVDKKKMIEISIIIISQAAYSI